MQEEKKLTGVDTTFKDKDGKSIKVHSYVQDEDGRMYYINSHCQAVPEGDDAPAVELSRLVETGAVRVMTAAEVLERPRQEGRRRRGGRSHAGFRGSFRRQESRSRPGRGTRSGGTLSGLDAPGTDSHPGRCPGSGASPQGLLPHCREAGPGSTLDVGQMDVQDFIEAVSKMRSLQKEYFKTRSSRILSAAMLQEKTVDKMLEQFNLTINFNG